MSDRYATTTVEDRPAPLLKWGAVFGGLILGLGLLVVLSALWFALAYGSGMDTIRDNLDWFIGGSAIAALFLGALLTGYLSGVRGAGTGALHGMTLWGLLLMVTLVAGIPSVLGTLGLQRAIDTATDGALTIGADTTLWTTFWTLLGGFVAAGIGGMIGGAMTRTASGTAVPPPPAPQTYHDDRTDVVRVDDDDDTTVTTTDDDDEVIVAGRRYRAV